MVTDMRIVHAAPYIGMKGGRSIFVTMLAREQLRHGDDVYLVGKVTANFKLLRNTGAKIINVNVSNNFRINNIAIILNSIKISRIIEADILHIHGPLYLFPLPHILGTYLTKLLIHRGKYKTLYTLHAGVLSPNFLAEIRLLKGLFGTNFTVITLSPELSRSLREKGLHATYIPNFYRKEIDEFFVRGKCSREKPIKLLYLGGFSPSKGVYDAVRAFSKAARQCNDLRLSIGGRIRKDIAAKVIRYLTKKRLKERVKIFGWLEGIDYINVLCEHHVLLHPSRYEGLPLVITDALAAAMPVIAYRVGGIPWIIREGYNGFLADTLDEMTRSITLICNNERLLNKLSYNARSYATKILQPDRVVNWYYRVYREN